jgi:acyl carrier protein
MDEIAETIKAAVAEIAELPIEKIELDAQFGPDLGVDSMEALELMARLEKHYGIVVPPENLPRFKTVRMVAEIVSEIKAKAAHA